MQEVSSDKEVKASSALALREMVDGLFFDLI